MRCNCIERLESQLTEKMKAKYPDGEIIEPVEFQNKTLIFSNGKTNLILSNPTIGRVKIGKSIRKYDVSMLPRYCPYCGELLEEKGE